MEEAVTLDLRRSIGPCVALNCCSLPPEMKLTLKLCLGRYDGSAAASALASGSLGMRLLCFITT